MRSLALASLFALLSLGADAPPALLPPLEAESWIVPLAVGGHGDAFVAVPLGSRAPRGTVVALHGNFDRAEWACGAWRAVTPEPFVLCPRGQARTDAPPNEPRWTYAGRAAAHREVSAGLEALRAKYGARLTAGPMVYAGFSLGAILGVLLIVEQPKVFPRAVLVEGGQDAWTPERARAFRGGGGERVLFVCGQANCLRDARRAAGVLAAAGVLTKVVDAGNRGHTYDGPVADATRREWPWLVEGLVGF